MQATADSGLDVKSSGNSIQLNPQNSLTTALTYYYDSAAVVLHSKTIILHFSDFSGVAAHWQPDRRIRHWFYAYYNVYKIPESGICN